MSPKFSFPVVPLEEVAKEDIVVLPVKDAPVILIVDDEKVIADTLSIILTHAGFITVTAYNGETALRIANAITPALLISDVVMPGITGVELAIMLTQSIPNLKVLLFSGQASTVDLLEKARHGGHYFTALTKPIHPTDMLKRISECLAFQNSAPIPIRQSSDTASYVTN
ncbi:MAG TPA: response regulator [Edaphobacter sp.]|jgi:DNA-binding NtrC family response regulator|nr:response regulator [Edaphobacter sp.]